MDDNKMLRKEIIFCLSAYLDTSIKEAAFSGMDSPGDGMNLEVLSDILITLLYLEKIA